ncbi:MAG TPA: serine/threonine-protein kinase, partial [Ktedonobacteraceae bacterium]
MNAEALIGTVLGSCTLQKLVGQGGMGAVFLAQQSRPRRQVAVKILLPMAPLSPNQLAAFLERFRRETDAAASMEHPNIVPVHEYGERDGLAYLVMPYISGGTLRDEMEREGPLAFSTAMNFLDQIAAALDFAHKHGVIHRDIKPANILMTSERRLLLTDFGLVKIVAEGSLPQTRLTGEGAPVGTPDYMAPEQVIGEDVDARADLYSLGVIVYQMITGTTPFQGETPMQIAAQHLQVPPPAPHLLRPDLPLPAE